MADGEFSIEDIKNGIAHAEAVGAVASVEGLLARLEAKERADAVKTNAVRGGDVAGGALGSHRVTEHDGAMTLEEFHDGMIARWMRTAPSYVTHAQKPSRAMAREFFGKVDLDGIEEAFQIAVAARHVERRQCLFYAYAIIRRTIRESPAQ